MLVPNCITADGRRGRVTAILLLLGLGWMVSTGEGLRAQTHDGITLVEARLIADSETVVPGRPVTIGLHLKMAPGWHTYWEYSGDSGLPTTLDLDLPDGFRATPLQWPLPLRVVEPGDLEAYAYKDEVLLLMRVFVPADLDSPSVVLGGKAEWLVCEAFCLPGQAEVSLELAVGDERKPANAELFERFQARLPEALRGRADEPVQVSWTRDGGALLLNVEGPTGWTYDFYPLPPSGVLPGHPETSSSQAGAVVRIPMQNAPAGLLRLPGVLVAEEPESGVRRGWRLTGR